MNYDLIISLVGLGTSLAAILFTAYTIRQNDKATRASFWLELRKMFADHDEVHRKLRYGGAWSDEKGGPESTDEWSMVESYMGLFEHCKIMLDQRLIDEETFGRIYRYRLVNLAESKAIRITKLQKHAGGWKDLLELMDRFEINYKKP